MIRAVSRLSTLALLGAAFAVLAPSLAAAHSVDGVAGGLESGFLHPLKGPDHLVAMVAVGLWGAQLGRPLIFALPIAFPLMMAVGGMLGVAGMPLPGVEIGIAGSAVALGLAVALAFRPKTVVAVAMVAAFAVFHGHAHGQELPSAADPLAYGAGFVLATGLLHLAGIGIGALNEWKQVGPALVRACGAGVAAVGAMFLAAALGFAG